MAFQIASITVRRLVGGRVGGDDMSIPDSEEVYFQATEAVSEVTGDGSGQISWCLQLEIQAVLSKWDTVHQGVVCSTQSLPAVFLFGCFSWMTPLKTEIQVTNDIF